MAISKIKVGSATAVELRDDASLHFRGHFDYGLTAGANNTYTGTPTTAESGGTDLTDIRVNDFITYGTENLNIVCTDISSATPAEITWTSTSESTAEDALSNISVNGVSGTVANHVASVNLNPAHAVVIDGTTAANNILPAGILTGTPTADGELANKKYVDDSTVLAGHMKYCGTLGDAADNPTKTALPVDGTAKVGDTYKVITKGIYAIDSESTPTTQAAKVGDLFICLTKTNDANTWTYIPAGDDVDVTSVDVSTGLSTTLPSGESGTAITTTGTINLKLKNGSTAFSSAAEAQGSTYRVCPVGVDAADAKTYYAGGNLAVAIPAGTLATTVSDVQATGTAVASITNTTSTESTGSFLAGHVGTNTGVDDDTLYLDYITPVATTTNVVTKTS